MPSKDRQLALSAVITTFNNADTLERCLASLSYTGQPLTDEILVLDSGSTDGTVATALSHGARIETRAFDNYSQQKQYAINQAGYDWVLLLDADEWLAENLQANLYRWLRKTPRAEAYRLQRREWLLWRWQHPWSKPVTPIRLFNRRQTRMNEVPVHAALICSGKVETLPGDLLHSGEADLHTKVEKINTYSSGQAQWRQSRKWLRLRMFFYPWFAFWREYLLRRQFLNGWAGFMAARSAAFYAFLKYAKAYELNRSGQGSDQSE
ncbi:MAG: glycosyltransferase family 2 protein [Proteobacteria bacterium]|nr:glycosyltransferase family 2 protein [Pseudomonadota bacterium]